MKLVQNLQQPTVSMWTIHTNLTETYIYKVFKLLLPITNCLLINSMGENVLDIATKKGIYIVTKEIKQKMCADLWKRDELENIVTDR